MNRKWPWPLAVGLIVAGAALLAYTVVVEDEPGALPLALLLAGAGWSAAILWRSRRK